MLVTLRRRLSDERGATLVLMALLMIILLASAGLVVNVGLVRADRARNKSVADVAVTAGMRGLDGGGGKIAPFRGACAALDYLKTNHPELSSLSLTSGWTYGGVTPIPDAGSPCDSTSMAYANNYGKVCDTADSNSARNTFAWYSGSAGSVDVMVKAGYSVSDMATDAFRDDFYHTDTGDAAYYGCDQLAVIVTERESAGFGKVVGQSQLSSRIRSVGRVTIDNDEEAVIALLLLERNDCRVLSFSGTNSRVVVKGNGNRPGLIHADSIAASGGANCSSSQILDGVASTTPDGVAGPAIVAKQAETGSPLKSGQVSVSALAGISGATPGRAATACPSTVVGEPSSCPSGSDRKGRAPVDALYRTRMVELQSLAATRTAWTNAQATTNGFVVKTCPSGDITEKYVFVDCPNFNNSARFLADDAEVIFNGRISVSGPLTFVNPRRIYVKERVTLSASGDLLSINAGVSPDCTARFGADRSKSTKFVIMGGALSASGGTARMCQTMVLLGNGTIPSSDGVVPYPNAFSGNIGLSGGGGFDWTAPNATNNLMESTDASDVAFLDDFENLALWTEAESGNGLSGGGANFMSGIFFLPNANEFTISGGAGQAIERDAQFITRKLKLTGNGYLTMRPNPNDSISFPVFKGFDLVR